MFLGEDTIGSPRCLSIHPVSSGSDIGFRVPVRSRERGRFPHPGSPGALVGHLDTLPLALKGSKAA
ncbi:hypothetical protein GCM10023074_58860 [Microbispora amethystogenes]|uniref:Uncharacterized protein n=1 Tax=Microbispora amethystogenes TaxID=1427754 RepID=A0ABQ4FIN9_9ACTN|nr:hypothetical protein Mam01_48390 [Microbispora amethystogenes]